MYTQTARTIIYYTLLDITHRTYTSYSSYVHGNTYVCIQCRVHIYIHPYIHACMHTYCFLLFCFAANRVLVRHSRCIHTNICTSIHICMHVYERTYVRTYVRTYHAYRHHARSFHPTFFKEIGLPAGDLHRCCSIELRTCDCTGHQTRSCQATEVRGSERLRTSSHS